MKKFGILRSAALGAIILAASAGTVFAEDFVGPYTHNQWSSSGIAGGTTVILPAVRIESAAHCQAGSSVFYSHDILSPIPAGYSFDIVQRFLVRGTVPFVQYRFIASGLSGLPIINVANNAAYSRTDTVTASIQASSNTFDLAGLAIGAGTFSLAATVDLVNFGPGLDRPFPVSALRNFISPGISLSKFSASPKEIYLGYDVLLPAGSTVTPRSASFTAIAPCTGLATFDWEFNGYHAFFNAFASLEVFSTLSCGEVTQTLVANTAVSGSFTFAGASVSIPVEAGASFGIRVSGENFDIDSRLIGTIRLHNFSACLTPPPEPCFGDADGNRVVNFADITSVLTNFGVVCP